jgi:hypothetical protein
VSADRRAHDRFWQNLPDIGGRSPEHLGRTGTHGFGPPARWGHAEGGANHGDDYEGIGRRQAGPLGRQGHELAPVIDEEGAGLAPDVPVGQEVEFLPA